jgi:four helix bundle protein
MSVKSFRELVVWQKAMDLIVEIYAITKSFPREELFGLSSQIKRCSISIASNIAEGSKRSTRKDYRNFLYIAYGSSAELQTQIEVAYRLNYINENINEQLQTKINEIAKMLYAMINKLQVTSGS